MAADGKNVYLVKLGPNSFGDRRQDICKDKASNLGPAAEFSFCVRNRRFCNLEFLFLVTFEGNIQCAKKVLRLASAMEYADCDK